MSGIPMNYTSLKTARLENSNSSDDDSFSDGESDSDESSSETESSNASPNQSNPIMRASVLQQRGRPKLIPCVLDSLLWYDLDFQKDFRTLLECDNLENESHSFSDEDDGPNQESNAQSGDESDMVIKSEAISNVDSDVDSENHHGNHQKNPVSDDGSVLVIKTELPSDVESESENVDMAYEEAILPDVPTQFQKKMKVSESKSAHQDREIQFTALKHKVRWDCPRRPSNHLGMHERLPFDSKQGHNSQTSNTQSLTVIFQQYFTPDILNRIVQRTNLNYEIINSQKKWKNVTVHELLAFVAINVAMGLDRRENLGSYWSTYPALHTPWFGSIMSRQRFRDIHHYLMAATTSKEKETFHKISPLLKLLPLRFQEVPPVNRWLVIDEQVLGSRCKMSYLQNLGLPTKPIEWGLKVFTLSDALTGYVHNFYVYPGREQDHGAHHPHGVAYDVAMKLLEKYHGKHYVVFVDNFFTSPQLFLDLFEKGTLACGICRMDRKGFPANLANAALTPGQSLYSQTEGLVAVKWAGPMGDVCAMSTYYGSRSVWRDGNEIPIMLDVYNDFMGNASIWDQPTCYYSLTRKPVRWWRKVFWRLVDLAIGNVAALRKRCGYKLTNASLRQQLVMDLVKPYLYKNNIRAYQPVQSGSGGLAPDHLLTKIDDRGECVSCKNRRVRNFCMACQKHLCSKCAETYHSTKVAPSKKEYVSTSGVVISIAESKQ